MRSFLKNKLGELSITNGLAALLVRTAKEEGAEGALDRLEPAFVERLARSSAITSAVASCAIEGFHVGETRAEDLAAQRVRPTKRAEHEVLNYKMALEYLFGAKPSSLQITPELLKHLHRLALNGHQHAGSYKTRENSIIDAGTGRLRFTPVSAKNTEEAVDALCLSYNEAINKETAPPQVCIAALVLDFTCIHPFTDGNGRVSRLATTAALLELGFRMPKLVSLEEIIQNNEHQYYTALAASSEGWHTGNHDLTRFLRFHLETIASGYEELRLKIKRTKEPVTVILDALIPKPVRERAFREFQKIYENASWKTADLRKTARKVTIEGYEPSAELSVFEKLKHANRLAERCLQKAEGGRAEGNEGEAMPM